MKLSEILLDITSPEISRTLKKTIRFSLDEDQIQELVMSQLGEYNGGQIDFSWEGVTSPCLHVEVVTTEELKEED